jgi:hypothetical protein
MVRSHIRLEDPLKQTYRYNQVVMVLERAHSHLGCFAEEFPLRPWPAGSVARKLRHRLDARAAKA